MEALIKVKIVTIERRAAAHGMNRPRFAAAPRASKFSNRTQMSLGGFEWFVL
jgi:hypothetical protein